VTRVTPAGVTTDFTDPDAEIGSLRGIVSVGDGPAFVVTDGNSNQVGFFLPFLSPSDTFPLWVTAGSIDQPSELVVGADGKVWWTNRGNDTLGRMIVPDSGPPVVESYPDSGGHVDAPVGLANGPDDNLWFTAGTTRIGRFEVDATPPLVTVTTPQDQAVFTRGQVVNADFMCSDPGGPGGESCDGTVNDGEPLDTSTVGTFPFDVSSEDAFGNATLVERDYSVVAPRCAGRAVTVMLSLGESPTGGPDVIYGTPGPDAIDGGAGADVMCGLRGADIILGRGGNDRADGGLGNDTATGGLGADTLNGGAGNDTLTGGDGNDRMNGGLNRDTCRGQAGAHDSQTGCEVRSGIP
jgi:Ca2+-binding RTX toxin-like protein